MLSQFAYFLSHHLYGIPVEMTDPTKYKVKSNKAQICSICKYLSFLMCIKSLCSFFQFAGGHFIQFFLLLLHYMSWYSLKAMHFQKSSKYFYNTCMKFHVRIFCGISLKKRNEILQDFENLKWTSNAILCLVL